MTDASFGSLVVRMLISLAIVFAFIGGGYVLLRRRQQGGMSTGLRTTGTRQRGGRTVRGERSGSRSGLSMRSSRNSAAVKGSGQRRAIRVVGRVGIGRATQLVAVQFVDQVYLLAASEQGTPNVIAQLPLDEWLAATDEFESVTPITPDLVAIDGGADRTAPRGFVDALREATVRRA
jgi:hypothetical protein